MIRFPRSFGRNPKLVPAGEPAAVPSGTVHTYRPDIDGLRALAVLPVVFYHAGFRGFGGGYVGVDIFFVISGYLITGIIVRDLAENQHSLARFYRRRILRIFPAMFLVAAVTTIVACLALMPNELTQYAHSLAAATLFGSNILFYAESGYFDAASEVKPLLHTWSLAIEEQFYILWPLLLVWAGAFRLRRLRAVVWAVIAISLIAAVVMVSKDRSAAFYLLPSRAWELALGGALATLPARSFNRRWLKEGLALAGVVAILVCVWKYGLQTPFPGIAALPVCVGAALVILTGGNGQTTVARVLSLPPFVFVGKISYSLYLWHWPVLVFTGIWLLRPPDLVTSIAAVAVSFLLAVLSWRFVETPFRIGAVRWSTKAVVLGAAAAMATALAVAISLVSLDGLTFRFARDQAAVARYINLDQEESYRRGSCFISDYSQTFDAAACLPKKRDKPLILLIGDSYAAHLYPGLAEENERYDIAQATLVGCAPTIYPGKGGKRCEQFFRSMLTQWVPENRPDAVLLAGRWHQRDFENLKRTLTDDRLADTQIILIGPPPQYHHALPRLLVQAERRGDPDLPMRLADDNVLVVDKELRKIAAATKTPYLSLTDRLCNARKCRVWAEDGIPLQFDTGHFSQQGSKEIMQLLKSDIAAQVPSAKENSLSVLFKPISTGL